MTTLSKDRLHGTLDALVLKTLGLGPRHGYAIARWLEQTTGDAIQVEEGSLYPALYRMEKRGWIEAEWESRRSAERQRSTGSRPPAESSCGSRRQSGRTSRPRCRGS